MKTRKTIVLGLIVALAIGLTASCASAKPAKASQEVSEAEKTNIIRIILEGLTASTQEAAEIQRRLTAEQKQAFLERYANITEIDPGLEKVREAKGADAKLAQIWENLKEGTGTVQAREQTRRAEINERIYTLNPYLRVKQEIQNN